MEHSNIIIFWLKASYFFFRVQEEKSAFFSIILIWCSFIMERLWKKDSVFSSVHSFLHILSLNLPCADLFCQHLLSALPSLSLRADQKAVICHLASTGLTRAVKLLVSSSSYYKMQMWRFWEGQVTYSLKVQFWDSLNHLWFRVEPPMGFWMK